MNSSEDDFKDLRYSTIGSTSNAATRKVQVRRSATVRERGRVERNERRRRQEFGKNLFVVFLFGLGKPILKKIISRFSLFKLKRLG